LNVCQKNHVREGPNTKKMPVFWKREKLRRSLREKTLWIGKIQRSGERMIDEMLCGLGPEILKHWGGEYRNGGPKTLLSKEVWPYANLGGRNSSGIKKKKKEGGKRTGNEQEDSLGKESKIRGTLKYKREAAKSYRKEKRKQELIKRQIRLQKGGIREKETEVIARSRREKSSEAFTREV